MEPNINRAYEAMLDDRCERFGEERAEYDPMEEAESRWEAQDDR